MRLLFTATVLLISGIAANAQTPSASQPATVVMQRVLPFRSTLYVANADGSGERPLLASPAALDYNPAWSLDGKWIAFTSERNGSADLYRVKPDGTGLERLSDHPAYDDQAAFSPRGDEIVFVTTRFDGTADLAILNVRTRKTRALTSGPGGDFRPSWSPDGQWIAFSSDRGRPQPKEKGRWWVHLQQAEIYIVHPDGSGLKRLTDSGGLCGSPKWTRDSRRVVAYCMSSDDTLPSRFYLPVPEERSETRLVSIDTATGKSTEIVPAPGIKMSPTPLSSGKIAYVRKDSASAGLFYEDGKSGPAGAVRSPSWSPNDTQVVYHRLVPDEEPYWVPLWSRDPEYRLISTRLFPVFHPDGKLLVASTEHGTKLLLIRSGENAAQTLFDPHGRMVFGAQWSPTGDALIFGLGSYGRARDGGGNIATIKSDGSGYHELTSGANNNGYPSFSPDGKRFVYRTFGPEGQGLRIKSLADGNSKTLTIEYDNFPLWSPRADTIFFVRQVNTGFQIFSIRSDGQELRQLTNSPGNNAHVGCSPDGEWILFATDRMGFKDEVLYTHAMQPQGEIFVMRYDGSNVRQLTDNQWEDGTPAWQPYPQVRPED